MSHLNSYASAEKDSNICVELNQLEKLQNIQGSLSSFIFGVKRNESEIAWIAKVQNKLLNGKISKAFYLDSLACISSLKKTNPRFKEDRNLDVVQVDLFFGYANSLKKRFDINAEKYDVYYFLFENIYTDDYILSYSVIRALGVFSTPKSVDTLFQYALDKNNRLTNRKLAMNSLDFIGSHYSIKKLEEAKEILSARSGKGNANILK